MNGVEDYNINEWMKEENEMNKWMVWRIIILIKNEGEKWMNEWMVWRNIILMNECRRRMNEWMNEWCGGL